MWIIFIISFSSIWENDCGTADSNRKVPPSATDSSVCCTKTVSLSGLNTFSGSTLEEVVAELGVDEERQLAKKQVKTRVQMNKCLRIIKSV